MTQQRHAGRGERGAVFVQVGIAVFVLVSFNVFVLDYGMMWAARRQAQNSADAAALGGAVARAYDEIPSSTAYASAVAHALAQSNLVWKQSPASVVTFDCPTGVIGRCVRVDIYRNGEAGSSPIPTMFGPVLGITSQGVRATATAVARSANGTTCLKPWAIPDDWSDDVDLAPAGREFSYYDESTGVPLGARDDYTPPTGSQSGNTVVSNHTGARIIWDLNVDLLTTPFAPITREQNGSPGFTVTGVLPLTLPGGKTYLQNMSSCNGEMIRLNDTLPIYTSIPAGDAAAGLQNARNLDPGATIDINTWRIKDSCAPGCAFVSPRLLAVVLYDPRRFQLGRATGNWTQPGVGCPSNAPCVYVSNIVGLFLHEPFAGYDDHGHILKYPGLTATGAPTFTEDASWLVTTNLVR